MRWCWWARSSRCSARCCPRPSTPRTAPFPWLNGAQYLLSALLVPWPPLGLAALLATVVGLRGLLDGRGTGLPALVVATYAGIAVVTNGDIFPDFRFLVPAVPALGAALAFAVTELVAEARPRVGRAAAVVLTAAVVLPPRDDLRGQGAGQHPGLPALERPAHRQGRPAVGPPSARPTGGSALAGQLAFPAAWAAVWPAEGETVAFTDIGLFGYVTPARICDLLGLADPVMGRRMPSGPVPPGQDVRQVLWQEQREHVLGHADWIVLSRDSDRWQKLGLDDTSAWRPVADCGTWHVAATPRNPARARLPPAEELGARLQRLREGVADHQDLHVAVLRELIAGGADDHLVATHLDWLAQRADRGHSQVLAGLRCDAGLDQGCTRQATACGAAPPDVRFAR